MTTSKPSYGGRRPGAGRKSKSGKTVVKRIPESLVPAVDALIEHAVILTQTPAGSLPPGALLFPESFSSLSIPIAGEKIPAGFPSPAEQYVEDFIDFNSFLIINPAATFAVRSGGQSMLDAGIDVDDLLIIDRSVTPRHRDIVMADLGNEFTIKRLHKIDGKPIELRSENAAGGFPDFIPADGDTWSIVGVVLHIIKSTRKP